MPFLCIYISQGSVATCLKRGGIFKYKFVANLLMSQLMKKFWKSDNSSWSYGQEFGVLFFWLRVYTTAVHSNLYSFGAILTLNGANDVISQPSVPSGGHINIAPY